MNISKYCKYLTTWIQDKVKFVGAEGVIVGVSGGVDSAVVAVLAKKAFPNNCLTVFLPCATDPSIQERIIELSDQFNLNTATISLDATLAATESAVINSELTFTKLGLTALTVGNVKARLRMTMLYFLAQTRNYLVLGTDNAAEWYNG